VQDRIKSLKGVRNFRDFGGYRTAEGRQVRTGKLFRAAHFAEAHADDLAFLETLNLTLHVDLRRPDERDRQPNLWPGDRPVTLIANDGGREEVPAHVAVLSQDNVTPDTVETYMQTYFRLAPSKPHHIALFRDWFSALSTSEGAAVVHCAAGKDRTGILCALTHLVLGVDEADMFADYELTNTAVDIERFLPQAQTWFNQQLGKSYDADVYRPFMGVRRIYLETAFAAMNEAHGSALGYAREILGVDAAMTERLRDKYLVD
jgi:protein-tyrosine phosphatase